MIQKGYTVRRGSNQQIRDKIRPHLQIGYGHSVLSTNPPTSEIVYYPLQQHGQIIHDLLWSQWQYGTIGRMNHE